MCLYNIHCTAQLHPMNNHDTCTGFYMLCVYGYGYDQLQEACIKLVSLPSRSEQQLNE